MDNTVFTADHTRPLRVYERSDLFIQSLTCYIPLFEAEAATHPYIPDQRWEVGTFKNGQFWWARDVDLLRETFYTWMDEWIHKDTVWDQYLGKFNSDHQQFTAQLRQDKQIDLPSLSKKEMAKLYHQVRMIGFSHLLYAEYTVDQFDDFFAEIFSQEIKKVTGVTPSPEALTNFIQPTTLSANAEYRKRILKESLSTSIDAATIHDITDEFSWFRMSWDGSHELTPEQVQQDIDAAQQEEAAARKQELDELEHHAQTIQQQREELLQKHSINLKETQKYSELLDTFNVLHDKRKEIQMRCNQIIFRILRHIPERTTVPYQELLHYYPTDIEALLEHDAVLAKQQISERQQGVTWLISSNHTERIVGARAMKLCTELVIEKMKPDSDSSVQGMPACAGTVQGTAFVTASAKDANQNIQEGQILITSMTTVDFIPAMKKAAGIITDDGGATCHAAMVSREFNTPCIVGTKHATQVFSSGDEIKLDALKGIANKV